MHLSCHHSEGCLQCNLVSSQAHLQHGYVGSRRPGFFQLRAGGSLRRALLLPLPLLHLTDYPEALLASNVSKTTYPIVGCMVPKARLANCDADFALRTEDAMREVSRDATVMRMVFARCFAERRLFSCWSFSDLHAMDSVLVPHGSQHVCS